MSPFHEHSPTTFDVCYSWFCCCWRSVWRTFRKPPLQRVEEIIVENQVDDVSIHAWLWGVRTRTQGHAKWLNTLRNWVIFDIVKPHEECDIELSYSSERTFPWQFFNSSLTQLGICTRVAGVPFHCSCCSYHKMSSTILLLRLNIGSHLVHFWFNLGSTAEKYFTSQHNLS